MKICVEMLTNNEIKVINSLSRKKERLANGLFIVEGDKNIEEVIQSSFTVRNIYGIDTHFKNESCFTSVNQKQLDRISQYKSASEALALVELPSDTNIDFNKPSIILEDVNDPGNLGTIIRTADWFGYEQVVCSPHSVDCFNPKVVSATKGSLFRVKIVYTDLGEFITGSSLPTAATSLQGNDLSTGIDLTNHHIVFGNESHGISADLENLCDISIRIPSFNSKAESLNLGVSVGIICGITQLSSK